MKFGKKEIVWITLFFGFVGVMLLGLMNPKVPPHHASAVPAKDRQQPVRTELSSSTIPGNLAIFTNDPKPAPSLNAPPAQELKTNVFQTQKNLQQTQTSAPQSGQKKPRQLQDPMARVALAAVGMDADAEAYWLESIFDSSLPDKEREDLMEDLNEEGFVDAKNPTEEDLPLIMARMQIIEGVVPFADDFMLRHLGEAYKDLYNLLNRQDPH